MQGQVWVTHMARTVPVLLSPGSLPDFPYSQCICNLNQSFMMTSLAFTCRYEFISIYNELSFKYILSPLLTKRRNVLLKPIQDAKNQLQRSYCKSLCNFTLFAHTFYFYTVGSFPRTRHLCLCVLRIWHAVEADKKNTNQMRWYCIHRLRYRLSQARKIKIQSQCCWHSQPPELHLLCFSWVIPRVPREQNCCPLSPPTHQLCSLNAGISQLIETEFISGSEAGGRSELCSPGPAGPWAVSTHESKTDPGGNHKMKTEQS